MALYQREKPNQGPNDGRRPPKLAPRREATGRVVLAVETDEAALCAALIEGGFISPNDQDDRRRLEAGLSRLVEIILTSRVTATDQYRIGFLGDLGTTDHAVFFGASPMTIAEQIGRVNTRIETVNRAREFAEYAVALMRSGGDPMLPRVPRKRMALPQRVERP